MRTLLVALLLHSVSTEDIQPPPYNAPEQQVTLGQRIALGFFASTTFGLTILVLYLRSEIARQTIRRLVGGLSAPLLGGNGGYGFTVIGVLVLQVLTSFLLGIGLQYEWQQFIFGLLILPMVALYGRSPHIRATV